MYFRVTRSFGSRIWGFGVLRRLGFTGMGFSTHPSVAIDEIECITPPHPQKGKR